MSAHPYGRGAPSAGAHLLPGHRRSDRQVMASLGFAQVADHAETRYRWEGRVQESDGANIRSCNVYLLA